MAMSLYMLGDFIDININNCAPQIYYELNLAKNMIKKIMIMTTDGWLCAFNIIVKLLKDGTPLSDEMKMFMIIVILVDGICRY